MSTKPLPEKSLNGFWSRRFFFESFGCLGCFIDGNYRIWGRGCSRGNGQETMSSQVQQPCQTLELPPKSWPQIPWRADQRSASFQKLPLGSGMVAGFWVWILGGFLENAQFCCLAPCAKNPLRIRTQNPHTQLKNPRQNPRQKSAPKSAPKTRTKIHTQNPHQNPRPSSQPIPTETHNEKGTRGVPWATRCCYSRRHPRKKNRTKNPLRDSGGNLMAINLRGNNYSGIHFGLPSLNRTNRPAGLLVCALTGLSGQEPQLH